MPIKPEVQQYSPIAHGGRSAWMKEDDFGGWVRSVNYEALQSDRDQQYDMKVKAREQRDAVTAKLKALQAECEKLRKDAERLDFLEAKAKMSFSGVVLDFVKYVFGRSTVESGFVLMASGITTEPKDTLRLATDAAMQEPSHDN